MGRVHVGHRSARDAKGFLVAGDHVDQHARAAVVGDELPLPMPLEVPLRAEAGGAFDAAQNEVQVARELGW